MPPKSAQRRPGGRPRLLWTESRKRKLARLYLMTDLSILEIGSVLSTGEFTPGSRNIQTQLKALFPDNATEWRRYRPASSRQMQQRLTDLKLSKQYHIAKHSQRGKARYSSRIKTESTSTEISPYYDPLRHYDREMVVGVPSHFTMPCLDALYTPFLVSENGKSTLTAGNGDTFSDKEVLIVSTPQPIECPVNSSQHNLLRRSSDEFQGESLVPKPDLSPAQSDEGILTTSPQGLKRSRSKMSSMSDSSSVRHLSIRLSSRMSQSFKHVNSVLSRNSSWRSSIAYARSIASSTMSIALSTGELSAWHDFVNASSLELEPQRVLDDELISLYNRSCCQLDVEDSPGELCITCGFSQIHQLARSGKADCSDIDPTSPWDRFGNTPIHHAAAAGNFAAVLEMMDRSKFPGIKNTSGETFLHVLPADSLPDLPLYLRVITKAQKQGYSFSFEDFRGRSVGVRFNEWSTRWVTKELEERQGGTKGDGWNNFHLNCSFTSNLEKIFDIFGHQGLQLARHTTTSDVKHSRPFLRFLIWANYIRNNSPRVTEVERRTCPFLWCREIFADPHHMLQHLYTCQHVSKGLYWCPEFQRPQRVLYKQDRLSLVRSSLRSSLQTAETRLRKSLVNHLVKLGAAERHSPEDSDGAICGTVRVSADGLCYNEISEEDWTIELDSTKTVQELNDPESWSNFFQELSDSNPLPDNPLDSNDTSAGPRDSHAPLNQVLESIVEEEPEIENDEEQFMTCEQGGGDGEELSTRESQPLSPHLTHLNDKSEAHLASALTNSSTCLECLDFLRDAASALPRGLLVQQANIGMRDERGYTVLALAAHHGFRDIVLQLLHRGANPNSRSYQGTSLLAHAASHLARAHKAQDSRLYASILSCMVVLTDHGAKTQPSAYDEFSIYIPSHAGAQLSATALITCKCPVLPSKSETVTGTSLSQSSA